MSNVRSYKDAELLERVEQLPSFKGWKKGVYDIWVRSKEDEFNVFDDKVYTFECKNDNSKPEFIMVCTGTSNAGSQGLKNFEKYGVKGCAVACTDVLVYNSHIYGLHGKNKYPAYIQSFTVGFPYTRDSDKDEAAENSGTVYKNRIGMNVHRASLKGSTKIDGWSVACLVRNQIDKWNEWLIYMNKRPLSVVVLTEF